MKTSSGFLKNVFTLISGNILAQCITLVSVPVITRLYTPEDFGVLALFMSSVLVLSKMGALCYERAIVLPREEKESIHLLVLSILVLVLLCSMLTGLVLIFHNGIATLVHNQRFGFWVCWVPAGVFLVGLSNVLRKWRLRHKEFRSMALSRILETGVSSGTKILSGIVVGAGAAGLIIGTLCGAMVAFLLLFYFPVRFLVKKAVQEVSFHRIFSLAKSYKKFPLFASGNTLLNSFSENMVVFLFSFFFTPAIVGYYSLGNRMLNNPLNVISSSFLNAYYQKASKQFAHGRRVLPGLKKMTLGLMLMSMIPALILLLFGRLLFGFVFGDAWLVAGLYVQFLVPWFFVRFLATPSYVLYDVYQVQDYRLWISMSTAVLRVLALVGGYSLSRDPKVVLFFFVVVNVLSEFATLGVVFKIAVKKDAVL